MMRSRSRRSCLAVLSLMVMGVGGCGPNHTNEEDLAKTPGSVIPGAPANSEEADRPAPQGAPRAGK
jgi:hypothetical protein